MATFWQGVKHRLLGVCDWDGCRCRICRTPRDEGHQWDGCKCQRCPKTRHEWDGCHCRRCDAERHEWKGVVCRSCHSRKDLASILLEHFPKDAQAIDDLLGRLNAIENLDWSTLYDWQIVELARDAIPCYAHSANYEIEVASACLTDVAADDSSPTWNRAESSSYVVPSALRLKRHDTATTRVIC